jgi:hypothetical protein
MWQPSSAIHHSVSCRAPLRGGVSRTESLSLRWLSPTAGALQLTACCSGSGSGSSGSADQTGRQVVRLQFQDADHANCPAFSISSKSP